MLVNQIDDGQLFLACSVSVCLEKRVKTSHDENWQKWELIYKYLMGLTTFVKDLNIAIIDNFYVKKI